MYHTEIRESTGIQGVWIWRGNDVLMCAERGGRNGIGTQRCVQCQMMYVLSEMCNEVYPATVSPLLGP